MDEKSILDQQLEEYEKQAQNLRDALVNLDRDYAAKKEQGVGTLNQITGAIIALRALKDAQDKTIAKLAVDAPAAVTAAEVAPAVPVGQTVADLLDQNIPLQ